MSEFSSKSVGGWHVLVVRPGHERQVEQLATQRREVEAFVPCRSEVRQLSDRRRLKWTPLFPGYAFVRGDLQNAGPLVTLPGVISFLRVGGVPALVTAAEMEAVRRMTEMTITVETWQELKAGKRIKILSGPLIGCEGEIVEQKKGAFFTVRLELLGRQIATPLDLSQTLVSVLPGSEGRGL